MKFPDEFDQARIDLEIDFFEKGGLQRFKTVGDFQRWLDEEKEFWRWLSEAPASNHHGAVSDLVADYRRFNQQTKAHYNQAKQRWDQLRPQIAEQAAVLKDASNSEESRNRAKERNEQLANELEGTLQELSKQLKATVTTEVLSAQCYLSRLDPSANFVKEIAEREPDEAVFALDQVILEAKKSSERRRVELSGRMLATLHARNLNKKVRHDQQAFEKAIVTWSKELADFKARYEAQENEFGEASKRRANSESEWNEAVIAMKAEFGEVKKNGQENLKAVTDAYDAEMKLAAPRKYWTAKKSEHRKGKIVMGIVATVSAILGIGIIGFSAHYFLPEQGQKDYIPWRSIGFFVLISTFVLWFVRLFVKLMLSHIHLYADAREREVMILTFMALVRRKESREGMAKADLALVLAPIFKPSTTGVIKDDGGPSTLADFISRLGGKT